MKLRELKKTIDFLVESLLDYEDPVVGIVVKTHGSIGGTPIVEVKNLHRGIDWDQGKVLMYGNEPVMRVNQPTLDDLRKAAEKYGWDMYENGNLKKEIKRLKAMLKEENGK